MSQKKHSHYQPAFFLPFLSSQTPPQLSTQPAAKFICPNPPATAKVSLRVYKLTFVAAGKPGHTNPAADRIKEMQQKIEYPHAVCRVYRHFLNKLVNISVNAQNYKLIISFCKQHF